MDSKEQIKTLMIKDIQSNLPVAFVEPMTKETGLNGYYVNEDGNIIDMITGYHADTNLKDLNFKTISKLYTGVEGKEAKRLREDYSELEHA